GADHGAAAFAIRHFASAGVLYAGGFATDCGSLGENPGHHHGRGWRERNYAEVRAKGHITVEVARDALAMLRVDEHGMDEIDRNLLLTIIQKYSGGPV